MNRTVRLLTGALALTAARPALAKKAAAAPHFDLAEKTGARIADTVGAVIAATHALQNTQYQPPHANTFFALQQGESWFVYYGWLEPDGSKFTPALVVSGPRSDPSKMAMIPVEQAPSDVTRYARAVASARDAAARATQNRNVNPVLLVNGKELDVYVLQGPGRNAVLLGGDFLDRYDSSGKKLISRTQFHKAIIPVPLGDAEHPEGNNAGSYHTHVIDEEPTATDVAEALIHPELTPMFVMGRSGQGYRVDDKGKIHLEPKLALSASAPQVPGKPDVPAAAPAATPDGGAK